MPTFITRTAAVALISCIAVAGFAFASYADAGKASARPGDAVSTPTFACLPDFYLIRKFI